MADLLAIAGGIGTGLGQVGKEVSALGEMVEKRRMREEEMGLKQALNRRAEEELGLKKAQDVRAADLAKEVREAAQRTNRIAAVEEKEKTRRERPIDVQQYMGQLGIPGEAQQTLLKWAEAEGAIESLKGMPDIKTSSLKYIVPFMEKLQKDPARLYQLSMISLSSMRKKLQELQAKGEKLKPEEQAAMQTLSTQYMGELAHAKALEAQLKMEPEKPYYPIGAGGAIGPGKELIPPQARVGAAPETPTKMSLLDAASRGDPKAIATLKFEEDRELRMADAKAKITQNIQDSIGFASWGEPEKEMSFYTKLITGKDPVFGWGDKTSRSRFSEGYNHFLVANSMDAGMVARIQSDYKSGDISLKRQRPIYDAMNSFVLNIVGQIGKVKEAYNKLPRTQIRLLNLPIRELRMRATGSGEEAAVASYLYEISQEIAKLSTGSSASIAILPEGARKDWNRVHDGTLPFKDFSKVLDTTHEQAIIRLQSQQRAMDMTRSMIESLGTLPTAPSSPSPFDESTLDAMKRELEKRKRKK